MKKAIVIQLFIFLVSVIGLSESRASTSPSGSTILMITSYNPDAGSMRVNIQEFEDEYKALGGLSPIVIENLNSKSFGEAPSWRATMREILDKYTGENKPSLIVLWGQEAWAAFISIRDHELSTIPVVCGLVSRNAVLLPRRDTPLKNWSFESMDAVNDCENCRIVGGYMYSYDVKANINLILRLFPETKNIAFVSDNTYGGVSLQSLVKKEMESYPNLNLILLDGREYSIFSILEPLQNLPEKTAILLGTWKVDMNEGYFMSNSMDQMRLATKNTPVFSISSIGMDVWALGGYMPNYRLIGKDMARQTANYFNHLTTTTVEEIPNIYKFDAEMLKQYNIDNDVLPAGSELINIDESFWEKYKFEISIVLGALVVLSIAFMIAMFFFLRTKRMKDLLIKSEKELRDAKERAEESNRLKSSFLANMSHEIRTPLNAIVGFSNLLAEGGFEPEDQAEFAKLIQNNSDLLLNLINDILDVSRLETGKIKMIIRENNLSDLCKQVLSTAEMARKFPDVEYVFKTEYPDFILNTDEQRLSQVMINLLSNAAKFTQHGSITLSYDLDDKGEFIIFAVTDTGTGIPKEKIPVIFERFEKLNEHVQGSGIGLSICKLITEKLGGDIWVDDKYDGGARFMFSHPVNLEITQ